MQKLFETFLPKAYALRMKFVMWGILIFDIILVLYFFIRVNNINIISEAFIIIMPVELGSYLLVVFGTYVFCLNKVYSIIISPDDNAFELLVWKNKRLKISKKDLKKLSLRIKKTGRRSMIHQYKTVYQIVFQTDNQKYKSFWAPTNQIVFETLKNFYQNSTISDTMEFDLINDTLKVKK